MSDIVQKVEEMKMEKKKLQKKKDDKKKKKKTSNKPPPNPTDYTAIRRNTKKGETLTLTKKTNFKITDEEEIEKFYEEFNAADDQEARDDIIQAWIAKLWDEYDEQMKEYKEENGDNEDEE